MTVWGARIHLDPCLANAMYFAVDAHCFSYGMFKGMCEEILCRMLQSRRIEIVQSASSIQYNRCTSTVCGMKLNIDD